LVDKTVISDLSDGNTQTS